jgi:hypothetical protein
MPAEVMEWLAPANADVWKRSFHGFGEPGPSWTSISLDPGASWVESLKWFIYACAFVSGVTIARQHGAKAGAIIVFGAGVCAALVTLGHAAVDARELYGFYAPAQARPPWALAPLLNPNNMSGYLNLAAFTGIGLLVAQRTPAPRYVVAIGVAVLIPVSLLTGSRGGAAACVLGLLLIVPALRQVRRLGRHRVSGRAETRVAVTALVAGTGLLFLLGANTSVWSALRSEGTTKLTILGWTRPMIEHHPVFGVGRGAYETVFPAYDEQGGRVLYQFAENFVVQWAAEWGPFVAISALVALGWFLRPSRLRVRRDPVAAGAAVGAVVLLAQNLVDLGLEIPAVGIALAFLLGSLWGGGNPGEQAHPPRSVEAGALAASGASRNSTPPLPRFPVLAASFAGMGGALIVATATWGMIPAQQERARLVAAFQTSVRADADRAPEFFEKLRVALSRHPADPHLYLLGATAALESNRTPLRWISVAIERDRAGGRPHVVLAETLARLKARNQALLALRTAVGNDPGLIPRASQIALSMTESPQELSTAAPLGSTGEGLLVQLARDLGARRKTEARTEVLRIAIERYPEAPTPRLLDADDLLAALAPDATTTRCSDSSERCRSRLREHAARVATALPLAPDGTMLNARIALANKQAGLAYQLLSKECAKYEDRPRCLRLRVEVAMHADPKAMSVAAEEYAEAACQDPRFCARARVFIGQQFARRKDWKAASHYYQLAAFETGTPELWLKLAQYSARAGDVARSKMAIDRAASGSTPADSQMSREARKELLQRTLSKAQGER